LYVKLFNKKEVSAPARRRLSDIQAVLSRQVCFTSINKHLPLRPRTGVWHSSEPTFELHYIIVMEV